MLIPEPVLVDVRALFSVQYRHLGVLRHVVAYSVGYEVVDFPTGLRGVACQIVFDPSEPQPIENYYASQFESVLLFPRDLVRVRPYRVPG